MAEDKGVSASEAAFSPLHERISEGINRQEHSPFYNGRIPPEIRDIIFDLAITEDTKKDRLSQYPEDTNYTRPGYTGKRKLSINLLLLCRQTYLEAYHLPPVKKEHVFWHYRCPPCPSGRLGQNEKLYFSRFAPWQLSLVKEIHCFTQMYWLEDSFIKLCREDFMQGLDKIKLTIRRGDWWHNESNHPLGINPQRGGSNVLGMKKDWKAEKDGRVIPWTEGRWGCAFKRLKGLKELEIEFETSEDKLNELKDIVEHAKTWKFPMRDGMVLSSERLSTKKSTWRGTMCYWSQTCPYCSGNNTCGKKETDINGCRERARLRALKLGPMLTMISVRWKLATP